MPLLLGLLITAVWCWHYGKWSITDWQVPVQYTGDSMEVLARLKAAQEGDWGLGAAGLISRLGAPYGADWRAYPEADLLVYSLTGSLADWIGLYPAANLLLLLAHLLAGFSFYVVARLTRVRPEWALAGGLLFACSYFLFFRSLSHLSLTLAWTIPPALATGWLVARGRRLIRRHRSAMALLAVCIGLGSPYFLLLYLQLLVLALAWQLVAGRHRENIIIGSVCLALALLAAAAQVGRRWSALLDPAAAPAIVRSYQGTEQYSLKLVEMLLPPSTHRMETMELLARRYERSTQWRSEYPSAYLGFAGIAGILLLLGVTFGRVARRGSLRPPVVVWQLGWILFFAMAGGLANYAALITRVHVFRATNRYSIFILALALLVLVAWLSRGTRRWPRWVRATLAAVLMGVGLWDQVPTPDRGRQAAIATELASDRRLAAELQVRLGPDGALFQLPVLPFPEARVPFRMKDYEHFRPYLNTEGVRFSYGPFQRRSRAQWQTEFARLPAAQLARRLERKGFAGIYLNRAAFPDQGERLIDDLRAAGWGETISSASGRQTVVLLRPTVDHLLPIAANLTWGSGWSSLPLAEGVLGQTAQRGIFTYFNPYAESLKVRLELQLSAVGEGAAILQLNGNRIWQGQIGSRQVKWESPEIMIPAGRSVLELVAGETQNPSITWLRVHQLDWRVERPQFLLAGSTSLP